MASSSQNEDHSHQLPTTVAPTHQQPLNLSGELKMAADPPASPAPIGPQPRQPQRLNVEADQMPAGPAAPPPPSRLCDKCMEWWTCLAQFANCFNNLWECFSTCTECDM